MAGPGTTAGSTVLISGTAGTGKTSFSAQFADATCARGERCLYVALEESASQIIRNMRSIGIELERWVNQNLLDIRSTRPAVYGLETHLANVLKVILEVHPRVVIFDPISSLLQAGTVRDAGIMVTRLIDFLKAHQVTVVMADLTAGHQAFESTEVGISSLVDTWLLLRSVESGGARHRQLSILKSRGMANSNRVRGFLLTNRGIELQDGHLGPIDGQETTAASRGHQ